MPDPEPRADDCRRPFNRRRLLKQAFIDSLPVLMGYSTMGFAAGVLLAADSGLAHPLPWSAAFGAVCISGALQFMITDWLREAAPLAEVALITLCLNLRYSMYGVSMLDRFRGIGPVRKAYLIWAMTDETYALETANPNPDRAADVFYCLALAGCDHLYWVFGVSAGALAGSALPFSSRGIDFAMTALFLVILTDQCRDAKNRLPAVIGFLSSIAAWLIFGVGAMLIPSMILMTAVFLLRRKKPDPETKGAVHE